MRRKTIVHAVPAFAALVVALSGCGGGDDSGGRSEVVVDLVELSGSGQSGTATLSAVGQQTKVVIALGNPPDVPQPAHVHPGTCRQLDPTPAYSLENVEGGASETTLPVPLDDIRNADLVINVHKSQEEIATYSACGAIG